ncbi:M23 family metallopeptidase [Streptomyces palmae]|uniref:M23 family metallopeptidase n=1 Tax=Streptomyces palmae TaxID=1701085 RepID=A0A4Z0GIZ1_9ACTN|nr:M23 family metallopeptidase [Streptomyces palmae]TGA95204.1 M23 family metallopeptidase [Streptomyces palmae]
MTKHTTTRTALTAVLRNRAAIVGAGVAASVALGAGVALAADSGSSTSGPSAAAASHSVRAQADGHHHKRDAQRDLEKKREAAKKAARHAKRDDGHRHHKPSKPKSTWTSPVNDYVLGSTFGLAGTHWAHNHSGQDFVVPTGTSVKAAHAGTVVKAGPNGGGDGPAYGNAIVVRHWNGMYTQYAHLSKIKVYVGQAVSKGQQIGLSGNTGNSTGPHLHFEVRNTPNYGSAVNPVNFLRSVGAGL